jgi:hypothetical protein
MIDAGVKLTEAIDWHPDSRTLDYIAVHTAFWDIALCSPVEVD